MSVIRVLSDISFGSLDEIPSLIGFNPQDAPTNDNNGDNRGILPSPWLVIPTFEGDIGRRSSILTSDLGPNSISIWFETFEPQGKPGNIVTDLSVGQSYQIAVRIENQGTAPCFSVCVDFMAWTSTSIVDNKTVHYYTFVASAPEAILMDADSTIIRSSEWVPGGNGGLFPGDIIIRAYDPSCDHYTETGVWLYVQNDRHLAHHSF